jgi:hypothetical protein
MTTTTCLPLPQPEAPKETNQSSSQQCQSVIATSVKHVKLSKLQGNICCTSSQSRRRQSYYMQKKKTSTLANLHIVTAFVQNIYVPNFAAKQPGVMYYYSPLNVYLFGVVDMPTEPII